MIAFDVETTGLEPEKGHRIVEIGMIVIDENKLERTGEKFHEYFNPQRIVPEEAVKVHNLSNQVLEDKPLFSDIVDKLLGFIGDHQLLAHNASFDMSFLNAEIKLAGKDALPVHRFEDSLELARREKPELNRHNLDALCRYYKIDTSKRTFHGALLDTELLTEVYFRLICGDKDLFSDVESAGSKTTMVSFSDWQPTRVRPEPLKQLLTEEEELAHKKKIAKLGEKALWTQCG